MSKLIGSAAIISLGVATTITVAKLTRTPDVNTAGVNPAAAVVQPVELRAPTPSPTPSQGPLQRPPEPIRPYILALGSDHVTICWMTVDEGIGKVRLFSYSAETVHEERQPASRYHKVSIDGLHPGRTYRYEIGFNYRGKFTTADGSSTFEAAVFGHPGGTERPMQYPTEMLPGRLIDISPEIALCTGDITYHATVRNFRDAFFHRFGEFMSSKPIYVAPSNHDGLWNGQDYSEFRRLFPRDFGPETGGSYWFDYKHARFFALTYKLRTPELFREHVSWLADAIDKSEQEFHIVFLGGQEPEYFDKDLLFRTLSERRVDLVFGGDGGGVWQQKPHGVDFFFSGNGSMGAYPFYYLRFFEYHFNVQTRFSDGSRKAKNYRSFYSSKKKKVVQRLEAKQKETENYILHYEGLAQPSTSYDGVHLTIDWDYDLDAELQLQWKTTTRGGQVREQYHLLKANTKSELLIHIPTLHSQQSPGKPYELDGIVIRLTPQRVKFADYPLQGKVSDVYLFSN